MLRVFGSVKHFFSKSVSSVSGNYEKWRYNRRLTKMRRRSKNTNSTIESELEMLTNELIEETIGPDGLLERHFQEVLSHYSAEPDKKLKLEEDDVKNILKQLIKEAVSKRNVLNGRIEKSVENGAIFERYYGKVQIINTLTNRTYAKLQLMQACKRRYDYMEEVYRKVTGEEYIDKMQPKEQDENLLDVNGDVWTEFDEAGGIK